MSKNETTVDSFYSEEEIRSRLGISTLVFHGVRVLDKAALNEIRANGIGIIEIFPEAEQFSFEEPSSMCDIRTECEAIGLSVASFHCPSINYGAEDESERRAEVERSKRMIDTLISLGGRVWVVHADINLDQTKKTFEELVQHYEGQDVYLAIENGRDLRDYVTFVDAIAYPQVGMIVDIGHTRTSDNANPMTLPSGPTEQFRIAGHRLKHLHLHDFYEDRDHRAPFDGEIQWVELFQSLKDISYEGVFMFEPAADPRAVNPIEKVGLMPARLIKAYSTIS